MTPKYFIDDTVRFNFEGKEYEGVTQGIKQGTGKTNGDKELLYFVWTDDQGRWVRESKLLN